MKLYRGIKAAEYLPFTDKVAEQLRSTWRKILERREVGDFNYPEPLNREIREAFDFVRLQRQHFTDKRDIALDYAKDNNGVLIEIDVPLEDLLKEFHLEFQNFGKRKELFEVVYVVDASKLASKMEDWKFQMEKPI